MFTGDQLLCVRGGRVVFADLSFALEPGRALILRGPNGSGKSSLLRITATLMAPAAGTLSWQGSPIDTEEHRARLLYVGHGDAVKPVLSVRENLGFWAALAWPEGDRETRVGEALETVGLGPLAEVPAQLLSAGERRRLGLARLLVAERTLWVLDEPTVALDRDNIGRFTQALRHHLAGDGLAIIATHVDIDVADVAVLELSGRHQPVAA